MKRDHFKGWKLIWIKDDDNQPKICRETVVYVILNFDVFKI